MTHRHVQRTDRRTLQTIHLRTRSPLRLYYTDYPPFPNPHQIPISHPRLALTSSRASDFLARPPHAESQSSHTLPRRPLISEPWVGWLENVFRGRWRTETRGRLSHEENFVYLASPSFAINTLATAGWETQRLVEMCPRSVLENPRLEFHINVWVICIYTPRPPFFVCNKLDCAKWKK